MPVYIVQDIHQLNEIILDLTQDHMQQIKIHVCKLRHRDTNCCDFSQMMHDGQHPFVSIAYIAEHLEHGARVIVQQLMHHFPDDDDNNDEDFILTCPGCGARFSQQ